MRCVIRVLQAGQVLGATASGTTSRAVWQHDIILARGHTRAHEVYGSHMLPNETGPYLERQDGIHTYI